MKTFRSCIVTAQQPRTHALHVFTDPSNHDLALLSDIKYETLHGQLMFDQQNTCFPRISALSSEPRETCLLHLLLSPNFDLGITIPAKCSDM